jgi:hypothetical protein
MQQFQNAIVWLEGKKAIITGLVAAVLGTLVQQNVVSAEVSNSVLTVLGIIFGMVSYYAGVQVKASTALGSILKDKRN